MDNEKNGILSFVMLKDTRLLNVAEFVADLRESSDLEIRDVDIKEGAGVLQVDDKLVSIAQIIAPIPATDINYVAQYAYNWRTAIEDLESHRSQLIVYLFRQGSDTLKCYAILTKVICSLLRTTNAIGVYKGNQDLLITRQQYLSIARHMQPDVLPLHLWVYFGFNRSDKGNSVYTYGLREFNKNEVEVVHSEKEIDDLQDFIYNTAHYILLDDITFKHGETIGATEDEKIEISFSKGVFINGDTFKLNY